MKKLGTMNVCVATNGASCEVPTVAAGKVTLWSPLPQLFSRGLDMLYTWQDRASQRQHLRGVEPRLLADMGLTRAEAEAEISKPFWKK